MPIAESRGLHVQYLDEGHGAPVVMVHSGGMSSRQWSRLVSRVAPARRAIAIDLLGYAGSDPVPPDAPFAYAQDLAAIDAVLANVPGPYHLVGHSYGGMLALMRARDHGAQTRSLSVYEPVAFGVLHSAHDADGLADLATFDRDDTLRNDATGGDERWMERFVDYWNGAGAWKAMPAPSRAAFLKVGRKVYQEVVAINADRTPHTAYASIAAPVLVLRGEHTTPAARGVSAVLARTIPNAREVVVAGAGHMGPLTHAPAVNELIEKHIAAAEG